MTSTRPAVVPVGLSTPCGEGPAPMVAMLPRSTFQPAPMGLPSRVAAYETVGVV